MSVVEAQASKAVVVEPGTSQVVVGATGGATDAGALHFLPVGDIVSTTVQGAIPEAEGHAKDHADAIMGVETTQRIAGDAAERTHSDAADVAHAAAAPAHPAANVSMPLGWGGAGATVLAAIEELLADILSGEAGDSAALAAETAARIAQDTFLRSIFGTTLGVSSMAGGPGGPITLTFSSVWGVNGAGLVYYNAAGVTPGEEAILRSEPDGTYIVFKPGVFVRGYEDGAHKGQPNGYAGLDGAGRVFWAQLPATVAQLDPATGVLLPGQIPAVAISDYLGDVGSAAAMVALAGQRGDWCTRSDLAATFILRADDPTLLASWKQLPTPVDAVLSVNGRTGLVIGLAEDNAVVHLAGAENVTGAKNFTGGLTKAGVVVPDTNDARFTDARTPLAHHATHEPGGTDAMAVDAAAATGSLRTLGAGATQAAAGTDARFTDARAPTGHHATHEPGGGDALSLGNIVRYGTLAARPAASATLEGIYYFASNDSGGTLYQCQASAWVQLAKGVTAAPALHALTHALDGTDPYAGGVNRYRTGYYHFIPHGGTTSTSTMAQGTERAVPFLVLRSFTLTRIGVEVSTVGEVGSKIRLGIRNDDGSGVTGTLLLDAGTVAGDSATVQEITVSQALTPGLWWLTAVGQLCPTTAPTIRTASGIPLIGLPITTSLPGANASSVGFAQTGVTGALPSSFTPTTSSFTPRILAKLT